MYIVSLIIKVWYKIVSYNTLLRRNCHILQNSKGTPYLKQRFKTFTLLKVENKTLFDENFLKVPVWSNKINNLQISFSPLHFTQNILFRKNDHFIIYIPVCRLGMSEWINGYKIQKRKWKYFKNKSEPSPWGVLQYGYQHIQHLVIIKLLIWVKEQPLKWKNKSQVGSRRKTDIN